MRIYKSKINKNPQKMMNHCSFNPTLVSILPSVSEQMDPREWPPQENNMYEKVLPCILPHVFGSRTPENPLNAARIRTYTAHIRGDTHHPTRVLTHNQSWIILRYS